MTMCLRDAGDLVVRCWPRIRYVPGLSPTLGMEPPVYHIMRRYSCGDAWDILRDMTLDIIALSWDTKWLSYIYIYRAYIHTLASFLFINIKKNCYT